MMPLKVGAIVEVGLPLYGDCEVSKRQILIADRGGSARGAWREAIKDFVRRNSTEIGRTDRRKKTRKCALI